MSKQDAAKFLEAINASESLQKKLLNGPANTKTWISEASATGHEVSEDDLRSATEQLLGKPVPSDQLVGTLRSIFEGELNDESLDAVAGGAGTPTLAQRLRIRTAIGGVLSPTAGAGANDFVREGGPVKVGMNPGGTQSTPGG